MDFIRNKKAFKFWEAVISHEENISIETLIKAFKRQNQTGVVQVLEVVEAKLRGNKNQDK